MKDYVVYKEYHSPCGCLLLGALNDRLCFCDWNLESRCKLLRKRISRYVDAEIAVGTSAVLESAECQLNEYFARQRKIFDIPLLFIGTDFQTMVWQELLNLGYGETVSYLEIANRVGKPKSIRAVANAIGANPISIIAPCHRVLGRNNTLTGYAGGLNAKSYLLQLEHF